MYESVSRGIDNLRLVRDVSAGLVRVPAWLPLSHEVTSGQVVANDFFGVNVATNEDPACDDVVVDSLRALGVRHVRLAYGYFAPGTATERLLQRLLAEDIRVLLSILPPPEDAASMVKNAHRQAAWRQFVCQVFESYGESLECIEVGNTPNRGGWSGYDVQSYLEAWRIAAEEAERFDLQLAGPNVSDFEPFYNEALLRGMRRRQRLPLVHTDNLFVERAIQPEAYDTRAAGSILSPLVRLNLVKKMRVLDSIARRFEIDQTYCTYNCWTHKRLSRWSAFPEQKGADYLVRYLVLAAATGVFSRVYWGPLIDGRDGLIDCGDRDYPQIDNVSHYASVRGDVSQFERRMSFGAMATTVAALQTRTCVQAWSTAEGLNHFVFEDAQEGELHILWTVDRRLYAMPSLYPQGISEASVCDAQGAPVPAPRIVSEHPLFLYWPPGVTPWRPPESMVRAAQPIGPVGTVFNPQDVLLPVAFNSAGWVGVAAISPEILSTDHSSDDAALAYVPDVLDAQPVLRRLRDKRNKLWNVRHPQGQGELTVKLNRARGVKRFTYRFAQSKGQRHWNNATEMLRRGIATPKPVAFAHRQARSGLEDNYYVCEFVEEAFSTRDLFTVFARGELEYRGIDKQQWLDHVANFIAGMHSKRIVHRDLSSGNILITLAEQGPVFYAIDIGRAVIDPPDIKSYRRRAVDLKRICYKLNWSDRTTLMRFYEVHHPAKLPAWWRVPLRGYDAKQTSKKALKRALKKVSNSVKARLGLVDKLNEEAGDLPDAQATGVASSHDAKPQAVAAQTQVPQTVGDLNQERREE